ncbi:MAG: hypothetical protein V7735_07755, partial [Photobacterium frigidiphilum]|uniref:hypothetical protein n=1 Tax=Photobacterium frigidiphilum TaxID=264736 RepID=UPI0030013CBC
MMPARWPVRGRCIKITEKRQYLFNNAALYGEERSSDNNGFVALLKLCGLLIRLGDSVAIGHT